MSKTPIIQVVFYISGINFEPDDITRILIINPSSSRSYKEAHMKDYAKSFWTLKTDKENSYNISETFKKLVDILEKKKDVIIAIVNKYCCETRFTVNIWIEDGERPEIVLDREILNFANSIYADIAFDIFID